MFIPRHKRIAIIGSAVSIFTFALAGFWFYYHPRQTVSAPALAPGQNVLINSIATGKLDDQALKTMTWADVGATAEGASANKSMRDKVMAVTASSQHFPALYLRALLLLSANDLQPALDCFLLIPPTEIPGSYLYAPYRLHGQLLPTKPNPFQWGIIQAAVRNELPLLIQARIAASEGRLDEALKAYLKTDPADWSDVDMRTLRGLRMQAGYANDTAVLLQAALRGGRVASNLRTQIVEVLNAPRNQAAMDDLKQQFLQQMSANAELRQAAITGAVRQLTVRQQFVGRKYRYLLDQHGARSAVDLPDETVLMLTLSAARLKDAQAFQRWSQELKRRYPTADMEKWLSQLQTPTPSSAP